MTYLSLENSPYFGEMGERSGSGFHQNQQLSVANRPEEMGRQMASPPMGRIGPDSRLWQQGGNCTLTDRLVTYRGEKDQVRRERELGKKGEGKVFLKIKFLQNYDFITDFS